MTSPPEGQLRDPQLYMQPRAGSDGIRRASRRVSTPCGVHPRGNLPHRVPEARDPGWDTLRRSIRSGGGADGSGAAAHRTLARLHLLVDVEAYFARLVQAIQSARDSILIRLYIFDTDPYALQLADLVKERSKTIRVQVLLDHLGSLSAARVAGRLPYADVYPRAAAPRSIVEYLQADSNVKVRTVANPWFTSDHTKAVIIDGERAFLGGMNIGQEYRYEWHDVMVEVEGPVAAQLARDFELVWAQTAIGGDLAKLAQSLSVPPEAAMVPAGAVPVRTLYTRTANPQILIAQLAAIRSARQYIYVEQPYVSDDEMIAALVEARRRVVDVRVVLPTAGDSGLNTSRLQSRLAPSA